jgi:hypothetical protein
VPANRAAFADFPSLPAGMCASPEVGFHRDGDQFCPGLAGSTGTLQRPARKGGCITRSSGTDVIPLMQSLYVAIDLWLRNQLRLTRHAAISTYAAEMTGSGFDPDSDLESAGIEHLLKTGKEPK